MVALKCPVCGEALTLMPKEASCPKGHCFDRAASGYLNLLLSQNKHTKAPGDSRDMVLSRRRFLDAGYYQPLREALVSRIESYSPDTILDAGCGEGYYTSKMSEICKTIGVDLSKDAVLRASKRDKEGIYCVASIFDLPVCDTSIDVITSVFAPYSAKEFARVARSAVIAVIPGSKHLFGLKELLYDTPYLNDEEGYDLPDFTLCKTTAIDFKITVEGEHAIFDLFSMTPYYWKTPRNATERLRKANTLKTEVSFRILHYEKNRS